MIAGVLASTFDISVFFFTKRIFGKSSIAYAALSFSLVSFYNMGNLPRLGVDTVEAVLNAAALACWPLSNLSRPFSLVLFAVACTLISLSIYLRPASLVNWVFPLLYLLMTISWREKIIGTVVLLVVSVMSFLTCACTDTLMMESPTLVCSLWSRLDKYYFLEFFDKQLTQPWHYYLTTTMPLTIGLMIPLFLLGAGFAGRLWPMGFVVASLWFNSLMTAKSNGFFWAALPPCLAIIGVGRHELGHSHEHSNVRKRFFLASVFILNLLGGIYLVRWHHCGPINALTWFRGEVDEGRGKAALFLMPCNSMPGHSFLHRNVPQRHLSCDPPADTPFSVDLQTECEQFYANPASFLKQNSNIISGVTHVMLYDNHLPEVKAILESYHFAEKESFFNSLVTTDERRKGKILVYVRQ